MLLGFFGHFVPNAAKVFLSAVAIADDIFAMGIIALFYTNLSISLLGFSFIVLGIALLAFLNLKNMQTPWLYLLGLALFWLGLCVCHIHPALAGFFSALFVPVSRVLDRLEKTWHFTVWNIIVPLFALCNAGVYLSWDMAIYYPVFWAIIVGLCIGKPLGIFGFSWLGIRCKWVSKSKDLTWFYLLLAGCFAGIGFTMSLLITQMAFKDTRILNSAKLAIPIALLFSIFLSYILFFLKRRIDARNKDKINFH
jgi:NhaA family Na+:H+ antiporter